jgi:hypothetical protein
MIVVAASLPLQCVGHDGRSLFRFGALDECNAYNHRLSVLAVVICHSRDRNL